MATSRWNEPFRKSSDPKSVAARHRGRLLAMDEVVSVGLGFGEGHRTVIIVGVVSEKAIDGGALPAELDGVPVEAHVVGKLSASDEPPDG